MPTIRWTNNVMFTVGDTAFHAEAYDDGLTSTADQFVVAKPPDLLERYVDIVQSLRPRRVLELGIYRGGSAALLAELLPLEKLVVVDISRDPIPALEQFVEQRGLGDVLKRYYGVDQTDTERLRGIIASEFRRSEIDLVIDDASHFLHETRVSFDALFPYVRAGGAYLIEDWSWAHTPSDDGLFWPDRPPLTTLVLELLLASAYHPNVVPKVNVEAHLALVRKGGQPLDPATFALSDCYGPRGRRLVEALDGSGPHAPAASRARSR